MTRTLLHRPMRLQKEREPITHEVQILGHRRTGPVHFFGGHTHFLVRFTRIPPPPRRTRRGSCTFFSPRPKFLLNLSIGLGVHEILQVIPAKMIDEQKKKNRIFPNFSHVLTEFGICPNSARNLPEFLHRPFFFSFFFFGGGALLWSWII